MKTLSAAPFYFEQIEGNLFKIYRSHYDIGIVTECGTITLHDEVIAGLEKKPHSGYWQEVVRQLINGIGKYYEKFKI